MPRTVWILTSLIILHHAAFLWNNLYSHLSFLCCRPFSIYTSHAKIMQLFLLKSSDPFHGLVSTVSHRWLGAEWMFSGYVLLRRKCIQQRTATWLLFYFTEAPARLNIYDNEISTLKTNRLSWHVSYMLSIYYYVCQRGSGQGRSECRVYPIRVPRGSRVIQNGWWAFLVVHTWSLPSHAEPPSLPPFSGSSSPSPSPAAE